MKTLLCIIFAVLIVCTYSYIHLTSNLCSDMIINTEYSVYNRTIITTTVYNTGYTSVVVDENGKVRIYSNVLTHSKDLYKKRFGG